MKATCEKEMQARLDEIKIRIEKFKAIIIAVETGLQLEYHTHIEELESKLAAAEQTFKQPKKAHDDI